MPLEIADVVRVTASVRPRGVIRKDLGRTLLLTTDDTLGAAGASKVGTYARFDDVSEVFASGTAPYEAAKIYFAQSPFPRNLVVGRWADADADTVIRGGAPETLAELNAITAGRFGFEGAPTVFGNLNLSGANTFDAAAATIQAAVRQVSGDAGATVVYSASPQRFIITLPDQGNTGLLIDQDGHPSVAGELGLTAATGATYAQGADAETIEAALDAITDIDDSFYFVALEAALNDTDSVLAVSAWVAANPYMFAAEANAAGVLTAQETASYAAQVSALQSARTFITWSDNPDYKALSVAARFSSVNFASPGSLITGKFKTLPGTLSDALTATAKQELDRKQVNHYSPYGGDNIYAEGYTVQPGIWIDVQYWIDWFTNAVQVDVYNLLRSSPRVPQTLPGIAVISEVIEGVCRQGVANGGIAPRSISPGMAADIRQATGDDEFDGELSNGYLVYSSPLSEQSQSERETRKSPPFRVWLAGAGAVHFVDINLTFEN